MDIFESLGIAEIAERYSFTANNVGLEHGDIDNGVLLLKPEGYPENQCCVIGVNDSIEMLLSEYDSSNFKLLKLWRNSFSEAKQLPEIKLSQWTKLLPKDILSMFTLIEKPIKNYDEYLLRLQDATSVLSELLERVGSKNFNYLDKETFDGNETQTSSVTGKLVDASAPDYREVKRVDESVWDCFYLNRNELVLEVRFHNEEALYQYLLDMRVGIIP